MKKTFLPGTFLINLLVIFLFLAACKKNEDDIQPDKKSLNEKLQALTDQIYADYLAENPSSGFHKGLSPKKLLVSVNS